MKLNTNSNTYTIVYASAVVIVVAFLLAFVSQVLEGPSKANERIDKKKQILSALNIRGLDNEQVEAEYAKVVSADCIIDSKGSVVEDGTDKDQNGFTVDSKDITPDNLPLYICQINGATKYVIPLSGKGLWGSIWGYIALNKDGNTVFGAYFGHQSETAGLGARISDLDFQEQFKGKKVMSDNGTIALKVVKKGQVKEPDFECDGISGATLTMNGVTAMFTECIAQYHAFLASKQQP